MANNVRDIKLRIIAKLNGISGLNGVYNAEVDKPTNGAYPFATVVLNDWEGEFGDTIRNIRRFRFNINIYQERTATAFGNVKAERLTDEMVDEVITAFDMDTTLSGTVKMVQPLSGNMEYIDREIGDTRIAQITVEAMTVVDSR